MTGFDRPLETAEIIAVGSELLGTIRVDSNSLYLAGRLGALGIELRAKSVVGDDRGRLARIFGEALARADVVILTGGLGPTDDDVTREAVTDALGLGMQEDPGIVDRIERRFAARGLKMPAVNRKQAMVPAGAIVLENPHGTAPGLLLRHDRSVVLLLPGPPRELQAIFEAVIQGPLRDRVGRTCVYRASLFVSGRSESHVEEIAQPLYSRWRETDEPIETTILATPGQVELHLSMRSTDAARAHQALEGARDQLVQALGVCAFCVDGRLLPQFVGDMLRERRLTFAAAESCTGGLLLARMTEVPGSSAYVLGGVVSYSDALKHDLLGVDPAVIAAHGAVSEATAAAMADGVHDRTHAGICVGITGIAGPSGGTEAKPVGTVVIAIRVDGQPLSIRTHLFPGARDIVRFQATQTALDGVRRILLSSERGRSARP